jgi:sodium-dependent dicarboxylate transporter 2/3/5
MVIFLTELTSNTATASLLLPVLGALAQGLHLSPLLLMVTATLCASFAFMLPVATPPNAIVFASHCIGIRQMARAGLWLNLIGVLLIGAFVYLWGVVFPAQQGLFKL